jgi:hypothetical protein
MSASAQRYLAGFSGVAAAVAAGSALAAAWEFLHSPFGQMSAPDLYAADAVFWALVAVALCALVIASLLASWQERVRLGVRLAVGCVMAVSGCAVALLLDPASLRLQDWLGLQNLREQNDLHTDFFAPWVERLAALSWVYAGCGVAVVLSTIVLALIAAHMERSLTRPTPTA